MKRNKIIGKDIILREEDYAFIINTSFAENIQQYETSITFGIYVIPVEVHPNTREAKASHDAWCKLISNKPLPQILKFIQVLTERE